MTSFTSQATNPFALAERYTQIRFTTSKAQAHQAEPYFDDVALSVSVFEVDEEAALWQVDIVTDAELDEADIHRRLSLLAEASEEQVPAFTCSEVVPEMWQHNLHEFPPLHISRYLIHGSHIKPEPVGGIYPICVDAGMAFGSGEHATTEGCLQLFDYCLLSLGERQRDLASTKQRRCEWMLSRSGEGLSARHTFEICRVERPSPQPSPCGRGSKLRILDMGCGSAILAMAAAKRLAHAHIVGVDIDTVSVEVAKENARLNGVSRQVKLYGGNGYQSRAVIQGAPYDIIFANILAKPLMRMAADLSRVLDEQGVAILSGLLNSQEAMVLAAHRLVGLHLVQRWHKDGWSALMLRKS